MKERPILFSAPMVQAILDGRKTQTRRVVKPQPTEFVGGPGVTLRDGSPAPLVPLDDSVEPYGREIVCPYGQPGDQLWVRETFAEGFTYGGGNKVVWYRADQQARFAERIEAVCDYASVPENVRWRPSIHMPRWASRITLEIKDVRVQRLQEISEADAIAEGIDPQRCQHCGYTWGDCRQHMDHRLCVGREPESAAAAYKTLWSQIHGPGSWHANPWVWAITFRRVA